jgi:hypothetical protein
MSGSNKNQLLGVTNNPFPLPPYRKGRNGTDFGMGNPLPVTVWNGFGNGFGNGLAFSFRRRISFTGLHLNAVQVLAGVKTSSVFQNTRRTIPTSQTRQSQQMMGLPIHAAPQLPLTDDPLPLLVTGWNGYIPCIPTDAPVRGPLDQHVSVVAPCPSADDWCPVVVDGLGTFHCVRSTLNCSVGNASGAANSGKANASAPPSPARRGEGGSAIADTATNRPSKSSFNANRL